MSKVTVGVVAGGISSEHEISCVSASGVMGSIDRSKFEPILIGITKSGRWVLPDANKPMSIVDGKLPEIDEDSLLLTAGMDGIFHNGKRLQIDILFPVLHGPYGEDGTFQGFCEMAKIPYVGSGVLASAVAMDKSFAKPIFATYGLKVAHGFVFTDHQWKNDKSAIMRQAEALNLPLFVKPARGGSSRGTVKVKDLSHLASAITEALSFDTKVMIEEGILGREFECAVLVDNGDVKASPLGEIKILGNQEFYDFEAKYLDDATTVEIPVTLPSGVEDEIRSQAITAFRALGCEGLARVDFFYSHDGTIVINEINTMPGLTGKSAFPKLWQAAGLSYQQMITKLIDGAKS
jgi:D-alanine-D-alanine ligase